MYLSMKKEKLGKKGEKKSCVLFLLQYYSLYMCNCMWCRCISCPDVTVLVDWAQNTKLFTYLVNQARERKRKYGHFRACQEHCHSNFNLPFSFSLSFPQFSSSIKVSWGLNSKSDCYFWFDVLRFFHKWPSRLNWHKTVIRCSVWVVLMVPDAECWRLVWCHDARRTGTTTGSDESWHQREQWGVHQHSCWACISSCLHFWQHGGSGIPKTKQKKLS